MIQSNTTTRPVSKRRRVTGTKQPFFLHIGLPKTATTMLQEYLFPNHSQIEYL